jgi:hypothetical protein
MTQHAACATIAAMVVNREVIQAIRLKRSVQEIESLLAQGDALAHELLQTSGLLEKGIDPRALNLTPEQLNDLIERARVLEQDLLLDETQTRRTLKGRAPV